MFAQRLILIFIASTLCLTSFGEFADSGNENDDPIFLGSAKNNPNPIRINQSVGTRSAMEGTTAEGTTSEQTSDGTVRNVDSSNLASLSQYAPVDEATAKFILELDECVKTVGAKYCQAAAQNILAKRNEEKQSAFSAQIAQAQQAAMSGDPNAIAFLKDLLAKKQAAAAGDSTVPFQLPQ
jgi:hypothetical protein